MLKFNWIWASARGFQQCGILTCVDSDEPGQPPLKFRNSKWCSVSSLTIIEYSSDLQRLWSDCAYHIPQCWKSHALTQNFIKWVEEKRWQAFYLFRNEFNKFNNTGARIFKILPYITQRYNGRHYVTLHYCMALNHSQMRRHMITTASVESDELARPMDLRISHFRI